MQTNNIEHITVIGAGLMGHGIALEFALAGYGVNLTDISQEKLSDAINTIKTTLKNLVNMGLVSDKTAEETPGRINTFTDLKDSVSNADFVIEAVNENLSLKKSIFSQLDQFCLNHTILASNSSSFMPSQIAPNTERKSLTLVAHYFNPPYLLPLVEIVRSPFTSVETIDTAYGLFLHLGKKPVVLQKEAPGFIANRIQVAILREAISIVEKGIASPEDVDIAVRNSFGRREAIAGPFEVADVGGWDVVVASISEILPDIESSVNIPSMARDLVQRGDLGMKTGKGIYEWSPESSQAFRDKIGQALVTIERLSSSD